MDPTKTMILTKRIRTKKMNLAKKMNPAKSLCPLAATDPKSVMLMFGSSLCLHYT